MTIGRDPSAETRTRRALDGVLVILNSLIESGDIVLDGPSHYALARPPAAPIVVFEDGGGGRDDMTIPGPAGATGKAGAAGMPGCEGPPGEDGLSIPGPAGAAGSNGATGAQGPTGTPLFLLEDGPQGDEGVPGRNGNDGAAGANGATGAQGPTGTPLFLLEDGPPGEDGRPGVVGSNGANGATGAQGPTGTPLFLLEDGPQGEDGRPGVVGTNGATGSQGPAGPATHLMVDESNPDDGYLGFPQQVSTGPVTALVIDNGTTTAPVCLTIGHNTTATPAATFGSLALWTLQDSTTPDTFAASMSVQWVDATHATRKASWSLGVFDTSAREIMRAQASGTAPMIGFLGAVAAVQQTGDAGAALATFGLMSGTPTFAAANLTGTVANAYVILEDQKTSGTQGGTFTSGSWQTRVLNTKVTDPGAVCTLASNQFTLAAGTYRIRAWAMARQVNSHQLRIQNVTDATTLVTGNSNFAASTDNQAAPALLSGRFTVAAGKALELQHQCSATLATSGLGIANSFGTEVYAHVEIEKEAT